MQYVCRIVFALLMFLPWTAFGANLSIVAYQYQSETRSTRTQYFVTYTATLLNTGPSVNGATAVVSSLVPSVQIVAGKNVIHFGPVATNAQVQSTDSFTILVDRSVPFAFTNLVWSFADPVANAGANQTGVVGATIVLTGSGSSNPSGVGTLTYAWSFVSVPPGSQAALTGPNTIAPSFVLDAQGNYVINLVVSNGVGTDSATVTVSTINSPPVANAGSNQTVPVGSTVHLNGSGSGDVDGDPITYLWGFISKPMNSAAMIMSGQSVMASFVADLPGTYVVQLVVNDGKVSSPASVVTITTANTPPVANAGPAQVVSIGAFVQLNGSGSTDVDGNPLTYKWSLITLPPNSKAVLSNASIVNPTFTADLPGTYVVQLIVNDGQVDSPPATVTISTNAVQPPTAQAGPNQTVVHGTTVTLNGSGTDPQSLPLTLSWSLITVPQGSKAQLSPMPATIASPTFTADLPGVYVAQLIVNNGFLNSAPATVTITTTNSPPVANAGPNQNVTVGASVILDGSGSSDADHDPLTFMWSFTSRPTSSNATLSGANTKAPTFTPDLAGTYVVQLIVNDGFVNSPPVTVTITANVATITLTPNPLNLTLPTVGLAGEKFPIDPSVSSPGPVQASAAMSAEGRLLRTNSVAHENGVNQNPTGTLTVTLSVPAGSSGQVVNFTGFDPTVISMPASATVPANSTGVNVPVTALAPGSTTVTASGGFFQPGNATVNVASPPVGIVVPFTLTIAPGATVPFPVTLAAPAQGAVTVTLTDSDTSKATLSFTSVSFNSGQTAPTRQPTITGVANGPTTITASAPGLTPGTSQVTVALTAVLSPANLTVTTDGTLTLTLSGPAPSAINFTLMSSQPGFATVPPSLPVSQGTQQISFKVTAVSPGTTVVTASAPGFANATANVTVAQPGTITLSTPSTSLQVGQTATLTVGLSQPAPSGGVMVTLTNDAKLTLSPQTVTIAAGATSGTSQITAVSAGSSSIGASAPGFSAASPLVMQIGAAAPASISVVSGSGQSAAINTAFAVQLASQVKDAGGNPLSGVTVTFTAPASGASGTFAGGVITAVTNASGIATAVVFTANGTTGTYTVAATTGGLSVSFTLTNTAGAPASITVSGGSGQSAQVNQAFAVQLAAQVKDAGGNPLSGVTVTYTAPPQSGASGTFAGGVITAVTNASGIATAVVFTANAKAGSYNVVATTGGLSVSFALTNTAGAPATIAVNGGNSQSTPILNPFANPLKVLVTDALSNPVSGATVTFMVPVSGASATFAGNVNTAVTNASGIAQSAVLTANSVAGTYGVVAWVSASITTNFTLVNQPGPPAAISAVSGSGQSAGTNTAFANPLVAKVTDQGGNTLRGISVTFTAPTSGAGATFAGNQTTVITDSNGLATSPQLTANGSTGTFTVTASVSGVAGAASFTLTITAVTGGGQIIVLNATIGQNLQMPLAITLNPPAPAPSGVTLTITSTNPSLALVGGGISAGKATISPVLSAGTTTVSTIVQALASSGTVTITFSAPGYATAQATITLAPAGFILQGPDGTSNPISTFEGIATPLTVAPVAINPDGTAGPIQQIRGGFSVNVTVSTDASSIGTTSPGSVGLTSGSSSAGLNFVASSTNTGTVHVSITALPGFTNPTTGAQINVTVQAADIIAFSATIGAGLQTTVSAALSGPTGAPTAFTFHSNNPSQLLFSTSATTAGTQDLVVTIPTGQIRTPTVWAQAPGPAGTNPGYQLFAAGFGSANGTVSIVAVGLAIQSPGGLGAPSFNDPIAFGPATLTVFTGSAPGGVFNTAQPVIAGGSVSVTVSSDTPSVGGISSSPITISAGSDSASTLFNPASAGSAVITVSASGFGSVTVTVTVTGQGLIIDSGFVIGINGEQGATVTIPAPAGSGGATVTIQSNSPSLLLAVNATDAGASQITVTIAQGSRVGTFFIYALANSGSGTYTATFPGVSPVTGTAQFTNSGFVIIPTSSTSIDHTQQTSTQLEIFLADLDSSGNPINNFATQPLAGNQQLRISVQSNSGAATVPATVSFQPGLDHVFVTVTIVGAGTATISVAQPGGGFTTPNPLTAPTSVTLNIT
jgi:hypothetical protein